MVAVLLVMSVLVPAVLVVVIVVVVVSLTRGGTPQQPGWQPPTGVAPSGAPALAPGGGTGVWNAQVVGDGVAAVLGGALGSGYGRFELADGALSFVPDGAVTPAWRVPCIQLAASAHGLLSVARVTLRGPMGEVRCNVSTEHLNRVSRNSAKTLRETRHARDFVTALRANGAWAG